MSAQDFLASNLLLSDIRKVTLSFYGTEPRSYLIHKDEVDRFVAASKRLHFLPGKNPHNGAETANLWQISVAELEMRGPYWWTTPNLARNDDPAGARIIEGGAQVVAFIDPSTAEAI